MMDKLDLTMKEEPAIVCVILGDDFNNDGETAELGLSLIEAVKLRDFLNYIVEKNTIDSIKEDV